MRIAVVIASFSLKKHWEARSPDSLCSSHCSALVEGCGQLRSSLIFCFTSQSNTMHVYWNSADGLATQACLIFFFPLVKVKVHQNNGGAEILRAWVVLGKLSARLGICTMAGPLMAGVRITTSACLGLWFPLPKGVQPARLILHFLTFSSSSPQLCRALPAGGSVRAARAGPASAAGGARRGRAGAEHRVRPGAAGLGSSRARPRCGFGHGRAVGVGSGTAQVAAGPGSQTRRCVRGAPCEGRAPGGPRVAPGASPAGQGWESAAEFRELAGLGAELAVGLCLEESRLKHALKSGPGAAMARGAGRSLPGRCSEPQQRMFHCRNIIIFTIVIITHVYLAVCNRSEHKTLRCSAYLGFVSALLAVLKSRVFPCPSILYRRHFGSSERPQCSRGKWIKCGGAPKRSCWTVSHRLASFLDVFSA